MRSPKNSAKISENPDEVIDKLMAQIVEAVRKDSDSENELDSEFEILKEAVMEADMADENEGSIDDDLSSDESANEDEDINSPDVKNSKNPTENKALSKAEIAPSENESDGVPTMHRTELEALKTVDPGFYKYLQENDAELLNFDESDDDAAETSNDMDKGSADDSAETVGVAVNADGEVGEEENDDDDEEEEARAAAEAGLELGTKPGADDGEDVDGEEQNESAENSKSKHIDMAYLRNLQTQLAQRRTSLRACKDLLRIFRSGRELAVSTTVVNKKKKALKAKKQRFGKHGKGHRDDAEDDDIDSEDEMVDDGSYVAGDIRFLSAKAYQKAMNMAIIGIQGSLDSLLGKPRVKSETDKAGIAALSAWSPREHPRWKNLEPVFRTYAVHMFTLTEHMQDAKTMRFLLKRLESMVPYTKEKPALTRNLIRIALSLWAAKSRNVSHATKLRAFLLLHAVANEEGNTEIVLRKVCQSYVKNVAAVCNTRTLPSISFGIKCIVELFGIDMGASYSVAFTHLRQIAMTLRSVMTSKDMKNDIEKIYNWSTINSIRLWSILLTRYGGEDELRPLIYPLVQVSLGILRLQTGPQTFPLRLHVTNFIIDVGFETGIYIPLAPHLLTLLKCAEMKKAPQRGTTRNLEWRSLLRVADDLVKTKPYLGGVIRGVVFQLSKYFAGMSKHVSFPEISHRVSTELKKFSKEVKVSEWRRDIMDLVDQLRKTAKLITDMRAKADIAPATAISARGMREICPGISEEMKTPIQRLYELELKRKEKDESHRDQSAAKKKINDEKTERTQDEVMADASSDEEGQVETKKTVEKPNKRGGFMALVASDEEPDEVADFQLSESEAE